MSRGAGSIHTTVLPIHSRKNARLHCCCRYSVKINCLYYSHTEWIISIIPRRRGFMLSVDATLGWLRSHQTSKHKAELIELAHKLPQSKKHWMIFQDLLLSTARLCTVIAESYVWSSSMWVMWRMYAISKWLNYITEFANVIPARMPTCNTKYPNPWKRRKCTFSHERQLSCWRSYPWITAPQLTGTMSKLTESESVLQSTLTKIKHCTRTLETRQIGFLIFLLLINKSEVFWLYPSKTSEIHKFLNTRSEKQSRRLKKYCLQFFTLFCCFVWISWN